MVAASEAALVAALVVLAVAALMAASEASSVEALVVLAVAVAALVVV